LRCVICILDSDDTEQADLRGGRSPWFAAAQHAVRPDVAENMACDALIALDKAGATFEIVAPKVGGAKASDGSWIEADQMIDGGPSVLYDAIALLPAEAAMDDLVQESPARDFVADAFAHCKFIGYVEAVVPLLEKAGIAEDNHDEGFIQLTSPKHATRFVGELGKLRVWGREPSVKMK
jgi:catalase